MIDKRANELFGGCEWLHVMNIPPPPLQGSPLFNPCRRV